MRSLILVLTLLSGLLADAQTYFPPQSGTTWDTLNAQQLGWCPQYLDTLDAFLAQANTKSFIILKDGKIVHERYFGSFQQDSVWYWASAGKTLMAFLVGKAQEEGLVDIQLPVSSYLGAGWTSTTPAQEQQIRVLDQLQMTTGLDYQVPDLDCTQPACLNFKAPAGNQWYYHNAPYLLVHDVLENATGGSTNLYTFQQLHQSIGFSGFWSGTLYISTARAMARFGLLMLAEGKWNGQSILNDSLYFKAMVSPSQSLNPAYGYLTWLNGQSSYIQPGLPFSFNGPIVPNAPADMYMAAGKNDQRIYVVPSEKLVVVRQGNAADSSLLALSGFDPNLWTILNQLRCTGVNLTNILKNQDYGVYPNPSRGSFKIGPSWSKQLKILTLNGQRLPFEQTGRTLRIKTHHPGLYLLVDEERGVVQKISLRP